MITINLSEIYLCLLKLSATICLISLAVFLVLLIAGVDIEHDEGIWGCIAGITVVAGAASVAMLIILLLALVVYSIWKI